MKWHSLEEPVSKAQYTNNTYCLVKYKDCCGHDQISDCLYRDGKFINLDSFTWAEITTLFFMRILNKVEDNNYGQSGISLLFM
jgi:hypothetical protein